MPPPFACLRAVNAGARRHGVDEKAARVRSVTSANVRRGATTCALRGHEIIENDHAARRRSWRFVRANEPVPPPAAQKQPRASVVVEELVAPRAPPREAIERVRGREAIFARCRTVLRAIPKYVYKRAPNRERRGELAGVIAMRPQLAVAPPELVDGARASALAKPSIPRVRLRLSCASTSRCKWFACSE